MNRSILSYQSNHQSVTNFPAIQSTLYACRVKNKWAYPFHLLISSLCFIWLVVLCLQSWSLKLEQEEEKNKALTEALQTLATEHHELQQSLCKRRRSSLSTLTGDDFYDAVSGQQPLRWTVSEVFKKSLSYCGDQTIITVLLIVSVPDHKLSELSLKRHLKHFVLE